MNEWLVIRILSKEGDYNLWHDIPFYGTKKEALIQASKLVELPTKPILEVIISKRPNLIE
jgi:hypothetical protein